MTFYDYLLPLSSPAVSQYLHPDEVSRRFTQFHVVSRRFTTFHEDHSPTTINHQAFFESLAMADGGSAGAAAGVGARGGAVGAASPQTGLSRASSNNSLSGMVAGGSTTTTPPVASNHHTEQ